MSYSSIWVMNKDFNGEELITFKNAWCFTLPALDALYHKYLNANQERGYMVDTLRHKDMPGRLNNLVNNSKIQRDRVLWEITGQQIFFTKDKMFIAKCIDDFAEANENKADIGSCEDRFAEIANCIRSINESDYPYFIFKNTSCDDGVEGWFNKYDENGEDIVSASLKERDDFVSEFVIIKDEQIVNFRSNLDYFKEDDKNAYLQNE